LLKKYHVGFWGQLLHCNKKEMQIRGHRNRPSSQLSNVMIKIFGDFRPFWAKVLAFFLKTNVMIQILAKN
jgi:hypothetical protein